MFSDIGVDAAKTGMLFSRALIETVADYLEGHRVRLVVDPVMVAESGAELLDAQLAELRDERTFLLSTHDPARVEPLASGSLALAT